MKKSYIITISLLFPAINAISGELIPKQLQQFFKIQRDKTNLINILDRDKHEKQQDEYQNIKRNHDIEKDMNHPYKYHENNSNNRPLPEERKDNHIYENKKHKYDSRKMHEPPNRPPYIIKDDKNNNDIENEDRRNQQEYQRDRYDTNQQEYQRDRYDTNQQEYINHTKPPHIKKKYNKLPVKRYRNENKRPERFNNKRRKIQRNNYNN